MTLVLNSVDLTDIIQVFYAVTGSMVFCTPKGEMALSASLGNISPEGVQNPEWTPIPACNNYFVIPCNMIIPLLKILLPSSNIIFDEYS